MFFSYIFCITGRVGRNFAQCHQDIKICIPFLPSGGAGGDFAQVLANWKTETVNLSFKVCMHSTRNKRTVILHHLLQYKRHMENMGTKTRHRKGDKVHMFGSKGRVVSVG